MIDETILTADLFKYVDGADVLDYGDVFDCNYGFESFELTRDDIAALLSGKVLYLNNADEYCSLIRAKKEVTEMTEIHTFRCDKCGSDYMTAEDANACECTHIEPVKIICCFYRKQAAYPYEVRIEMNDGRIVKYNCAEDMHGWRAYENADC